MCAMTSNSTDFAIVVFRAADTALFSLFLIVGLFVTLAVRNGHLSCGAVAIASSWMLWLVVLIEATAFSFVVAYFCMTAPCVFTDCHGKMEEIGGVSVVTSVVFIVCWVMLFVFLVGLRCVGRRGVSIFDTDVDSLNGLGSL